MKFGREAGRQTGRPPLSFSLSLALRCIPILSLVASNANHPPKARVHTRWAKELKLHSPAGNPQLLEHGWPLWPAVGYVSRLIESLG